jgi:tRNA dimethylallyltransferase
MSLESVFFIAGPTASGKSELAADVAGNCGAEIVSADAFQLYRGLPILTAQPDEATLRKAPHHLINCVPVTEEMNAEKFRALAEAAIEDINRRGKLALIVGGSGLYLKALTHGLAPMPAVDAKLRAKLNALSLDELNSRLAEVDPECLPVIDRQNKRRLVRALEIFVQTNAPASVQRREWNNEATGARGVFVFRERAELYSRIDRRVEAMFRDGVAGEVAHAGELSKTAEKTLGLGQVRQMLEGEITSSECIAEMQRATRRYAKRQLTWFRRQPIFEALNLSLLKDHAAAVDWILQKVLSFAHPLND